MELRSVFDILQSPHMFGCMYADSVYEVLCPSHFCCLSSNFLHVTHASCPTVSVARVSTPEWSTRVGCLERADALATGRTCLARFVGASDSKRLHKSGRVSGIPMAAYVTLTLRLRYVACYPAYVGCS